MREHNKQGSFQDLSHKRGSGLQNRKPTTSDGEEYISTNKRINSKYLIARK